MNEFVEENEKIDIPILQISKEVEEKQVKRLKELKASRNQEELPRQILSEQSGKFDDRIASCHLKAFNYYNIQIKLKGDF